MIKTFLILLTVALVPFSTFAVEDPLPQYLNFDGQLLDSSSTPITSNATVIFEIFDGNATSYCLLYKETQTVTPNAIGEFSTKIGPDAGHTNSSDDGDIAWPAIFANVGQVRAHNTTFCNTGYTPSSGHGRKLRVTVNGTALTPDYTIAPVPMASVAETLQGKKAADFLLSAPVSGISILTGNLRINNAQQLQLANTGSGQFISLQAPGMLLNGYSLILPMDDGSNGQILTTDGNGLLSWSTPSGGGAVTSIFGRTGAVVPVAGDYDAAEINYATTGNVAATDLQAAINELDAEKLSTAGGTVTGALNISGMLSMTNNIDMNNTNSIVNLTDPTNAQDAATKNYVDTHVSSVVTTAVGGINVTSAMITNGTITGADIAAGTVVDANINTVSINKIISGTTQYFTYRPNNMTCNTGAVLKWTGSAWDCSAALMSGANTDASNPGIAFLNDPNTGLFAPGADILVISTAGNEQMRIDATGNVGVGVAAPATKLDVGGVITARPSGTGAGQSGQIELRELASGGTDSVTIRAPDAVTASYSLTLPLDDGMNGQVLQTDGSGILQWVTIPGPGANSLNFSQFADTMSLDASTDIAASGTFALSITNTGTAPSFIVYDQASDPTPFLINGSGFVGIGTSTPGELLHIYGNSAREMIESTSGSPTIGGSLILAASKFSANQAIGDIQFFNMNTFANLAAIKGYTDISNTDGALLFFTSTASTPWERMRINSAGQVGIGTTAPVVDLDVNLTGIMRLKRQASAFTPTCDTGHDGSVALTNGHKMCVCNGTIPGWVNAADGTTACTF